MIQQRQQQILQPRRGIGQTGFIASVLGIGDLADRLCPLEGCVDTVRRAMDMGLNVIDTAPVYEDGYSEQIVGRALRGRREGMFVIDKIDHPDEPVAPQIEASLRRLEMDHVDLLVFHAVSDLALWGRLARARGGMEQLRKCCQSGKSCHVGISSHDPDVLEAAIKSGMCDVVMFPIGPFVDQRYVDDVLPLAKRSEVGTVCFKTFGAGKLLGDTAGYNKPLANRPRGKLSSGGTATSEATLPRMSVQECVNYTLTCDPDVTLLGMCFPNELEAAVQAAQAFTPLTPEQMAATRAQATGAIKDKGPCWWNPR